MRVEVDEFGNAGGVVLPARICSIDMQRGGRCAVKCKVHERTRDVELLVDDLGRRGLEMKPGFSGKHSECTTQAENMALRELGKERGSSAWITTHTAKTRSEKDRTNTAWNGSMQTLAHSHE